MSCNPAMISPDLSADAILSAAMRRLAAIILDPEYALSLADVLRVLTASEALRSLPFDETPDATFFDDSDLLFQLMDVWPSLSSPIRKTLVQFAMDPEPLNTKRKNPRKGRGA